MVELDVKAKQGDSNLSSNTKDEEAVAVMEKPPINRALHYTLRKGEHLRSRHGSQCFLMRDSTIPSPWSSKTVGGIMGGFLVIPVTKGGVAVTFSMRGRQRAAPSCITKHLPMPRAVSAPSEMYGSPFPLCQSPVLH